MSSEKPTSKATAVLLSEYVNLLNKGLPETLTKAFWEKVAQLSDTEQANVRKLCKTSEALHTDISPFRRD